MNQPSTEIIIAKVVMPAKGENENLSTKILKAHPCATWERITFQDGRQNVNKGEMQ